MMRYIPLNINKTLIFSVLGVILLITAGLIVWASIPNENVKNLQCGYDRCPKISPNKLNIHLVSHSHDDVGWYSFTFDKIYTTFVQRIINSVIKSLLKNSDRRFVFAEMAHLWRWWKNQNDTMKETLKNLINEGRFEIVGGGWSMNDEAVTYYQSLIDQYTWGLRRINDSFGTCGRPRVGWQIDPFGHSREQASIFAQLGYDGLFVGRLHYLFKWARLWHKIAEFIWKGSDSLDESTNLFTTILYNRFLPPPGFCFDIFCGARVPIVDDPNNVNYNVDERAEKFLDFAKKQAGMYQTNNIIITMGNTLTYTNAELWFANVDKLNRYINKRYGDDFQIFYSTPSCYLKALYESNLTWTVKVNDMFPYSYDRRTFWSGFYTSRPTLKYFERLGNNFLQVTKQLSVFGNLSDTEELQNFRETMGVMQHHEAITGTARRNVALDYARVLHQSIVKGEHIASEALNKWTLKKNIPNPPEFHSCLLLNISSCDYSSDHKKFVVTIYNPTSQILTTVIRVPVQKISYGVKDFTGNDLITQMIPIPEPVQTIPGRVSSATMELIFQAENISPLGFQSFYVYQKEHDPDVTLDDHVPVNTSQFISAEFFNISADSKGQILINVTQRASKLNIRQSFQYYEAAEGNNVIIANRSSGAYVFRPKSNFPKILNFTNSTQIFKGPFVMEIHQVINDWVSQVVRIYKDQNDVEFDWLIGPIPINGENKIGKEVISNFKSNIQNTGYFFTDSNGRQMIPRKSTTRPHFKLWLSERVASNYYPVTTKITIVGKWKVFRMSVLTDRSQGGSSLANGQIQLMLHRRLLNHDNFGGDVLNEISYGTGLVVRGRHYLIFGNLVDKDNLILREKEKAIQLSLRSWLFFTPTSKNFQEWNELCVMKGDGLTKPLPRNVRILTLEPWKDGEILLRLEHIFEKDESSMYSTDAQINLKELFVNFSVKQVKELTLGANQFLKDQQRFKWTSGTDENIQTGNLHFDEIQISSDSIIVTLKPMEIRTFVVKIQHGSKL